MTDLDLARRAVACKHFRWMPGMRAITEEWACRVHREDSRDVRFHVYGQVLPHSNTLESFSRDWSPDLPDPATVGCLLALVREAWGDPMLFAFPDAFPDRWTVVNVDCGHHATEAAALVAALEAAP